jgi:hypothetical protein
MAVDTKDKRASAIGCGLLCLTLLPVADGAVSALDRHQAASVYRLQSSALLRTYLDMTGCYQATVDHPCEHRTTLDLQAEHVPSPLDVLGTYA